MPTSDMEQAGDRECRGEGQCWKQQPKKVTFETNMFSQSLQPSFTCPLSPEQTCPNFTLLHRRNRKYVTSLFTGFVQV